MPDNDAMHRSRVLRGFWWSVFAGICFANCNPRFDQDLTRVPRLGDRGAFGDWASCRARIQTRLRLVQARLRSVHAWFRAALTRLRSVRILMARPGDLNALRQNGQSPKIVLDSNLIALENAANGETFAIHAGLFGNVNVSHRR